MKIKKWNELNEELHSNHPDRIDRSSYIFGDKGLEKIKTTNKKKWVITNDKKYWLTDEEYEKLKPFSENLSELLNSLEKEKKMRMQQFEVAVLKVTKNTKNK